MPVLNTNVLKGASLVGGGLLAYVVLALFLSSAAQQRNTSTVGRQDTAFGPLERRAERVQLHKAGFAYDCVECHAAKEPNYEPRLFVGEHQAMNLKHGPFKQCISCHQPGSYQQLIAADGSPLEYDRHIELCARCHGPTYRDWWNGAHGHREGYWDKSRGEQKRTDCIICHDPHHPRFRPIKPLPAPGVAVGEPIDPEHEPRTQLGKLLAEPTFPAMRAPAEIDPSVEMWK